MITSFSKFVCVATLLIAAQSVSALETSTTMPTCNDGTKAVKTGKDACKDHNGVKRDGATLTNVSPTPTQKSSPGAPSVGGK